MTRLSAKGAAYTASKEAVFLYAYDDGTGVQTVGIGHTTAAGGPKVVRGMRITLEQACSIFMSDMAKEEPRLASALKGPLAQNEYDGFASFDFNTGAIKSGTVDDRWNRGDKTGAMGVLKQYTKGGGKVLAGLVTRRAEEARIILSDQWPADMRILVRDQPSTKGRLVNAANLPWGVGSTAAPIKIDAKTMPAVLPKPAPQAKQNVLLDLLSLLYRWWNKK